MKELVSYIGVMGSGKDFWATKLKENYDYYHVNFADPVRESAWLSLGWKPKDNDEYEKFKACTFKCKELNHCFTGRQFLIRIGNDMGRDFFRDDFWIEIFKDKIATHLHKAGFCNSDTRYLNEVKAMKEIAEKHGFALKFQFCNFISERYNSNVFSESEFLAQVLVKNGCEDNQDVTNIVLDFVENPPPHILIKVETKKDKISFMFNAIEQDTLIASNFLEKAKQMKNLISIESMYFIKNGKIEIFDEINRKVIIR